MGVSGMGASPDRGLDQTSADGGASTGRPMNEQILSLLRCPLTHSRLSREGNFLVAEVGGLRYPIQDGIPVLLVEEAKLPAGCGSLEEFKARYGVGNENG